MVCRRVTCRPVRSPCSPTRGSDTLRRVTPVSSAITLDHRNGAFARSVSPAVSELSPSPVDLRPGPFAASSVLSVSSPPNSSPPRSLSELSSLPCDCSPRSRPSNSLPSDPIAPANRSGACGSGGTRVTQGAPHRAGFATATSSSCRARVFSNNELLAAADERVLRGLYRGRSLSPRVEADRPTRRGRGSAARAARGENSAALDGRRSCTSMGRRPPADHSDGPGLTEHTTCRSGVTSDGDTVTSDGAVTGERSRLTSVAQLSTLDGRRAQAPFSRASTEVRMSPRRSGVGSSRSSQSDPSAPAAPELQRQQGRREPPPAVGRLFIARDGGVPVSVGAARRARDGSLSLPSAYCERESHLSMIDEGTIGAYGTVKAQVQLRLRSAAPTGRVPPSH